mmetsp:Transcript_9657/g.22770  ORF Transcript_9657/g.22770 Transcript_9657/m.22770 type:complete len:151 (+) Transcript_9657:332-784(+)
MGRKCASGNAGSGGLSEWQPGYHSTETALTAAQAAPGCSAGAELGIPNWLSQLDSGRGLLLASFGTVLEASFGGVSDVLASYRIYADGESGALNSAELKRFFCDVGVEKIGHRRLFEKWFRERAFADTPASIRSAERGRDEGARPLIQAS